MPLVKVLHKVKPQLSTDKAQLFDNLYLSRFKRLWQQFRNEGGELMD